MLVSIHRFLSCRNREFSPAKVRRVNDSKCGGVSINRIKVNEVGDAGINAFSFCYMKSIF
jgi:hypothetical protein